MIIFFIYFNKLVKSIAANMTWASELCAVATSNNRQQRHCQSQWAQLKPSPIVVDAIDAFIVRRQSAHKASLSNSTRKAMAISLEATRQPCWQSNKGAVKALWVSWQYSPCNNKDCCKGVNHRKAYITNANCNVLPTSAGVKGCTLEVTTATIVTVSMANASSTSSATTAVAVMTSTTTRGASLSARTRASSSATYTASTPITCTTYECRTNLQPSTQTTTTSANQKYSRHDTCTTRHARKDFWTSNELSCLAEPVTPSSVTKEQVQAMTTKNTILLVIQI